jgi:hypothetical protein
LLHFPAVRLVVYVQKGFMRSLKGTDSLVGPEQSGVEAVVVAGAIAIAAARPASYTSPNSRGTCGSSLVILTDRAAAITARGSHCVWLMEAQKP